MGWDSTWPRKKPAPEGAGYQPPSGVKVTVIDEPLPVATTFDFRDENGESLSDVARLDTMVTVVARPYTLRVGSLVPRETRPQETIHERPTAAVDRRRAVGVPCGLVLGAGIALTFLLDYLDDRVRGKTELEAMGIAVLAEVPKK